MKNSDILNSLADFSLITFSDDYLCWNQGIWTINRVTEKAILVNGEWIPKSQITGIRMTERKKYDAECNYEIVMIPELSINSWFDKVTYKKRPKVYGF